MRRGPWGAGPSAPRTTSPNHWSWKTWKAPFSKKYRVLPTKKADHLMYGQIDYQQALLNASKSMIRVKDPITLMRLITRFVDRQIGATHVAVLLYDKRKDAFVLIDSKGESGRRIPIGFVRIPRANPMVRFFERRKNGGL